MFRTLLGDTALNSGVHYWELTADDRTENELKIGIFIEYTHSTYFIEYTD